MLELDGNGYPVDVKPQDTGLPHTLIEMFMVEANEAVAQLMVSRNIPCLRRVHDKPSELKDGTLRIDGLLRFEKSGDDWWEVDVSHGFVVGQRSGKRLRAYPNIEASRGLQPAWGLAIS